MKEKIMKEIEGIFEQGSLRDRTALKLVNENLRIEKDGRYYKLSIFGKELKIYCNKKYIANDIHYFIWHKTDVLRMTKNIIKDSFRKKAGINA